jgi:tRNA nucleotidyltransferase/poly(A) polymerase
MQWREELTRRFPALQKLGADCYVVGGAVRDLLLGIEPADVDLACIDPLASAKAIRDRVIRLGDDEQLTAYRVFDDDRAYDFAELLAHDIESDLARRDFTMNAMAVDLVRDVLLDPHRGQRDIADRLVRMVAASNFDDDPLRLLKGVRMAIKYEFTIEEETLEAIRSRAPRIVDVAPERVTYELAIILGSGAVQRALELLQQTRLAEPLGVAARSVQADDLSLAGAYAVLIDDPREHAQRWRWSTELLRDVLSLRQLIDAHDAIALYDAGERVSRQLPPVLRALGVDARIELPDFAIRPLLDGDAIAAATNLTPGPELGRVKRALLAAQIRGEVTTREEAEKFVATA